MDGEAGQIVGNPAAGDSAEQRRAESLMMEALNERLGIMLTQKRYSLAGGVWLEADGMNEDPFVLCEAWAHQGKPKSAQKNKVMTDALKLLYIEKMAGRLARKILLFSDDDATSPFRGNTWMAKALEAWNVEVQVVDLPAGVRAEVANAQKRQYR